MRLRILAIALPIAFLFPMAGANAALEAKIDKTSQTMRVYENGKHKHTWRVSTGTRKHRTPVGSWRPKFLKTMHYSRKYNNAPMPHSVFFHGGYAVHATSSISRLGRPASHGCIRLAPANARKFFKLVQKHGKKSTRIRISGRENFSPRRRYAKKTTRRSTRYNRSRRYTARRSMRKNRARSARKYKKYSSVYQSWNFSKPKVRSNRHRTRYTYYKNRKYRVVYYRNGRQYVKYGRY